MGTGSGRVTKDKWYKLGAFANPRCWRRQQGSGWVYFYRFD